MDSKVVLTKKNPHEQANIISKVFLLWSFKLFKTGYKRELLQDDLYSPRTQDQSAGLGDEMEKAWEEEVRQARARGDKPSLGRCIVRVFWLRYMFWGLWVGLLFVILWPLIPYTLALFIAYFSGDKTAEDYKYAHIYNFVMNALSVGTALIMNHLNLGQGAVGMQVRTACCSLLYRKLLKLDHTALGKTTPGQMVNLMSNDVNRFDIAPMVLHFIWVMPIVVPVVCYLVWKHIGVAVLAALAVIFLQTVLVQAYLSQRQGVLRGKIAKRTDERVRVMNELVNGVQVIKMYAWEKPFEKLVAHLRKLEVVLIRRTSMIKGFSIALTVFTERFILYAAIVTFVAMDGQIRSEITFSLVQYFNLLQLACNIFFPMALAALGEARVSVQRLEEFLLLEELSEKKVEIPPLITENGTEKRPMTEKHPKPTGLVLVNASASWLPDPIVHTLRSITLTVRPGEFLGVAGPVGAGKSSLLQVILGELPLSKGSISLGGARISYASQFPWLFVATVKQNILFGLPFDKLRYKKVVSACALLPDFEQLPHGDNTMVGERGISLSGGQRARIGLARAVYRQADIYLMDDPLSAVDTHVGKHLMQECVNGFLQEQTRVLVTHQLHHLTSADNIIVLRHGEIETEGRFEEVSKNALFSELLEEEADEEQTAGMRHSRTRTMSIQSQTSITPSLVPEALPVLPEEEDEDPGETSELMEKGRVAGSVYRKYFRTGGGWCLLVFTLLSFIAAQVVTSGADLWLTAWMNKVESTYISEDKLSDIQPNVTLSTNISTTVPPILSTSEPVTLVLNDTRIEKNASVLADMMKTAVRLMDNQEGDVDHQYYIIIWTVLIVGCIIVTTERSIVFLWVCMRASIGLHNSMFSNILQATMRFFDTNPSGRILNRFSKDMGLVDEILPRLMLESLQVFMVMIGILVMVAIVSPYMLLTTAVCGILMYLMTIVYLNTAQAIKRLEGVTRSPVFSHVTASMAGLATVRACDAQRMLRHNFDSKQDVHTGAWHLMLVTNTTFSIWLSLVSAIYVIIVAYTFLLSDDGTTKSGNVGLAISQALIMVNMVQYGIKQLTDVISQMTSVERIVQYTKLPQEHPLESPPGSKPPQEWPAKARIVFKNLYLRYVEDGEPVLKNLNITVESGWKVGVVGRTGAGKSSLISALFRLAILDGDVHIDEINTADIGLRDLRTKLSIIPQEPVLFSASLRYNLDPFDKHTDADIWKALEQVELKHSVTSLTSMVTEGGGNFSAGQRQLLCLARAALNHNRILVLDEATANVDPKTDALIQKTIRTAFADCTVITVAHRLHTVADSDRVLVMDAGQAVQYAHPHMLLQDKEGTFAQMVAQLGQASENNLRDISRKAYDKHIQYADAE